MSPRTTMKRISVQANEADAIESLNINTNRSGSMFMKSMTSRFANINTKIDKLKVTTPDVKTNTIEDGTEID